MEICVMWYAFLYATFLFGNFYRFHLCVLVYLNTRLVLWASVSSLLILRVGGIVIFLK